MRSVGPSSLTRSVRAFGSIAEEDEMAKQLRLYDGKYTILFDEDGSLPVQCLRHGQAWRDLIGDGMVLALTSLIEELQQENARLSLLLDAQKAVPTWPPYVMLPSTREGVALQFLREDSKGAIYHNYAGEWLVIREMNQMFIQQTCREDAPWACKKVEICSQAYFDDFYRLLRARDEEFWGIDRNVI